MGYRSSASRMMDRAYPWPKVKDRTRAVRQAGLEDMIAQLEATLGLSEVIAHRA